VIVSTCTDWSRDDYSSGVDCLPDVLEVDSSGDFFDQDGGESFRSEFLVHAEEIYLGCGEGSGAQHGTFT
jgi:hypothetical protein